MKLCTPDKKTKVTIGFHGFLSEWSLVYAVVVSLKHLPKREQRELNKNSKVLFPIKRTMTITGVVTGLILMMSISTRILGEITWRHSFYTLSSKSLTHRDTETTLCKIRTIPLFTQILHSLPDSHNGANKHPPSSMVSLFNPISKISSSRGHTTNSSHLYSIGILTQQIQSMMMATQDSEYHKY